MTEYVVDASVSAKWFLPEIHADAAWRLHNPDYQLHVPAFFMLEFGNILCKKVRLGELTVGDCGVILQALGQLPIRQHPDEALFNVAFSLANQTRRSLYDSVYLALALTLKGRFVTADRKLFRSLSSSPYAPHLCWIGDIP